MLEGGNRGSLCGAEGRNVSLSGRIDFLVPPAHCRIRKSLKRVIFCDYLPENANGKGFPSVLLRKYLEEHIFCKVVYFIYFFIKSH